MVSDLITAAVIILFAIIGWHRGIARSLLNLAAVAASAMCAKAASAWLSSWIYQSFIKQTVTDNLERLISENGVVYAVQNCFEAVPNLIKNPALLVSGLFGADSGDLSRRVFVEGSQTKTLAAAIEEPLGSLATGVLSIMLFFLLFIVFAVVAKLLARAALTFFEIPVLKGVNKFLGLILGAVEGIVISWLAINLFYVIMTFTNPVLSDNGFFFGKVFRFMCYFC